VTFYHLYGCKIDSNLPLPAQTSADVAHTHVLELKLIEDEKSGEFSPLKELGAPSDTHGRLVRVRAEVDGPSPIYSGAWEFLVEGVVSFRGEGDERIIRYKTVGSCSVEQIAFWYVHQVLPMYLSHLCGWSFLHASAIQLAGKALAFVAPSLGGKSTLAKSFVDQGHPIITDDKLPISMESDRLNVRTAHQLVRNYRQSEDLGLHSATPDAVELPLSELPLGVILFPSLVGADEDVALRRIQASDCYNRLQDALLFPTPVRALEHTRLLGVISARTPAFVLTIPRGLGHLHEVHRLVVSQLRNEAHV